MYNEGCNSCANLAWLVLSFIVCFIVVVIAPLSAELSNGAHPLYGALTQRLARVKP